MISFFVAASCEVSIPVQDQTADESTELNLDTTPSCAVTACTIQSGSSITQQAGYCMNPGAEGFSFYRNGQCLFAGPPFLPDLPDLVVAASTDVIYTCTNGNLVASLPIDDLTTGITYYDLDEVTAINCGDSCS